MNSTEESLLTPLKKGLWCLKSLKINSRPIAIYPSAFRPTEGRYARGRKLISICQSSRFVSNKYGKVKSIKIRNNKIL